MKKQYDKKVNPITNTFKASDKVLTENMSTKRSKGGKLQAKWIGPFPITKVSNSCVKFAETRQFNELKDRKLGFGKSHTRLRIYPRVSISNWKNLFYQKTNEDFELSTQSGNINTDYSTKVLLPVIQQRLTVPGSPKQFETETSLHI